MMTNLLRSAFAANKLFSTIARLRLLLVMFLTLTVTTNAWGETVEFTPSNCTNWTSSQVEQSQTIDGITLHSTKAANTSSQLRLYADNTHTITSTVGNITSVVFTCTANGTANYGPGKMSGDGYVASSGKTGEWTGNSTKVTLTGGQSRCTSIVVTYTPSSGGTEPPTPTTQHTINWHTAVGTVVDEVLEEGATITKPATDPTMSGYVFMGWTEDCEVASDGAGFTAISNFGTATENKDYYAVFAKANISNGGGDYIRVTQNLADWSGDYLIAYSNTIFANGKIGGTDGIGKQYNTVDLSQYVDNNIIPVEYGDPIHITLEKSSTEKYLLKTQDGKYNYYNSNNNGISSTTNQNTANQYAITITYTSKDDIKLCLSGNAQGAVFRYNAQGYFRFYKNGGQNPVYLYKKSAGTTTYSNYITTCTTQPTVFVIPKCGGDGGGTWLVVIEWFATF